MKSDFLTNKLTANGILSFVTGLLIFLIAIGSFALSYSNLHETALAYGVPTRLAWIWPLLIDFALIVFSLAVVQSNLNNEPAYRRWAMVALYTVATVAFNIYHAPSNLAAQVVAVVAPVTLFLSFETLMAMLKNGVIKRNLVASISQLKQEFERLSSELGRVKNELSFSEIELSQIVQKVAQKAQEVTNLNQQMSDLVSQVERLTVQKERLAAEVNELKVSQSGEAKKEQLSQKGKVSQEKVLNLLNQGLTQAEAAKKLRVSISTVKRVLNGKAAEVTQ
jgi:regulator of replication initiation timing